jgi:hypothetical protein
MTALTDTIRAVSADDRARMAALEMMGLAKAARDNAECLDAANEYQRHVAFAEQRLRQLSATRFDPLQEPEVPFAGVDKIGPGWLVIFCVTLTAAVFAVQFWGAW